MDIEGADRTKARVRKGGIVAGKRDPLRRAPLREPYAARSGASPEEQGTPESVTEEKSSSSRGRRAKGRGAREILGATASRASIGAPIVAAAEAEAEEPSPTVTRSTVACAPPAVVELLDELALAEAP